MAKICKKTILPEAGAVVFEFTNDVTLEINVKDLSRDIAHHATLHGLSQKIGDSYAGAQSVEEATANAKAMIDQLLENQWNAKAQTGGLIIDALMQITGETRESVLNVWNGLTDDERREIRKRPQVKAAVAEIQAKRARDAAEGSDTEDLTGLFA